MVVIQLDIAHYSFFSFDISNFLAQEKSIFEALNKFLDGKSIFGKEKACMSWFSDGDRITVFFHAMVRKRRDANGIHMLLVRDSIFDDIGLIYNSILSFHKDLYDKISSLISQEQISIVVSYYIHNVVRYHNNDLLTRIPYHMEFNSTIFALSMDSAPGLYRFGRSFYHSCWNIIPVDL